MGSISDGGLIGELLVDLVHVSHVEARALGDVANVQMADVLPTEMTDVLEP